MRFKLLFTGLVASSLTFAGAEVEPPNSVSVLNLSNEQVELWVNGEYRELNAGTALLYPCLQGEKVELQLDLKLDYVRCGEKREIRE
ncbi:hypothetical protein FMN52_00915 [Marinobacter sp. BW6]|uniref:hypothetical protein n=1 Tax=Marinobacter sp. BW6 TaxID=2592624 RepID=UPI0011DECA92|nr:hypothetical protein [Marinobacter sp. BW6]TYC63818.1 hypothetical protein FMN52_00915 [Marinobacter sp. BW6]